MLQKTINLHIKDKSNQPIFQKLSVVVIQKPYNQSENNALKNGFEEIEDEDAYNGRYFIKEGQIWIHNIEALKSKLAIYG